LHELLGEGEDRKGRKQEEGVRTDFLAGRRQKSTEREVRTLT